MLILGYGGSIHDFSYCLLEDEDIVCAVEEERISREKYGIGKASLLARGSKYCLNERPGQKPDMVVTNDLLLPQFKEAHAKDAIIINHHLSHAAGVFYTSGYDEAAILVADGRGSELVQVLKRSLFIMEKGMKSNWSTVLWDRKNN